MVQNGSKTKIFFNTVYILPEDEVDIVITLVRNMEPI